MSLFNALYTFGSGRTTQPIQENSHIEVEFDRQDPCARFTRWAKWVVTFPISVLHGAYNTAYMIATSDINKVISNQVYEGNSINRLQFLWGKSGHVITSSKVIRAITAFHREDSEGFFQRDSEDTFTPILRDLYPEETVDNEDFLFTCSQHHVSMFRQPLLDFVGPKALPHLRDEIDKISKEVLDFVACSDTISARYLAETYTVAVLGRLFLNHPGTLEDFRRIGTAASRVATYQFIKKWGEADTKQMEQYEQDLQTLRDAIKSSQGEFIESLKRLGLSPIQVKGELMLVYLAGSETTSSAMEYVLWRLGQDPDLQKAIRKNPELVNKFIEECTLEYTSVPFFSRFARKDLVISVENWRYPIAKGDALIIAPKLAGNSIFGRGVHSCPGQWLARAELSSVVLTILSNYEINSFPRKKELSTVPGLGFVKVEPVNLTLAKLRE